MNEAAPHRTFLTTLLCGLLVAVLMLFSALGTEKTDRSSAIATVSAAVTEPLLSAEAYVVMLAAGDTPLIGRRIDKPVAPASLTKIMTAVVAAEKLAPTDRGTMTAYAKNVEERKSAAHEGEEFLRDELIRMALIMSANDAALTLAERTAAASRSRSCFCSTAWHIGAVPLNDATISVAERVAFFVRLMNAKARILGMTATHFENPTGLDMPRHLTSARDLARLTDYVLERHPQLWAMTREQKATVVTTAKKSYALENNNDLLKEFPALIGGKTGRTDNAKEALMLLYPVEQNRVAIIVILRSDDRFGDGRKIIQWLEENF